MRRRPKETGPSFLGWVRPGPLPPGGLSPEEGETLDFLSGHFRIFQLERGHRFSVDDLLTAHQAFNWCPRAGRILDLGSGIGSIAFLLAWKLPGVQISTLEAQSASIKLAEKSRRFNGLADRIQIHEGDLRDPEALPGGPFDLVTGSPPYFPSGTVTVASNEQALRARVETRGTVPSYARAAAQLLSPGGLFVFVYRAGKDDFVIGSLRETGLFPLYRRDIVFREGNLPRISLYGAGRRDDFPPALSGHDFSLTGQTLTIRNADGSTAPEFSAIRLSMGFPPGDLPNL